MCVSNDDNTNIICVNTINTIIMCVNIINTNIMCVSNDDNGVDDDNLL